MTWRQPISRNQRPKGIRFISISGAAPGAAAAGAPSGPVVDSVLAMVVLPSRAQLMSSSALVARNWMAARTPVMMNRTTETAEAKP